MLGDEGLPCNTNHKCLGVVKGRIPLKELVLALKTNEKEYISRHLRGDKSDSAKLWRKIINAKNGKDYQRLEQLFFKNQKVSKKTAIKQELYWKIIDILDKMYFRNTLINKILTVSRLYHRFAGRGDKDAIINPYKWIPTDSVFWTQVPPWWWYEYSSSEVDIAKVTIDSKYVLDDINRILKLNTHVYRVASALRFIPVFKVNAYFTPKLIKHIYDFINDYNSEDLPSHYIAAWLIGIYAQVFSKLGFVRTVFDLVNGLAQIIPMMQELRKHVEIQYELKYEDDLGFMFSVHKLIEIISASSFLNVFGEIDEVKNVIDLVLRDPLSKQFVMLQVRAGSWYILNGYDEEGKKCLNNAIEIMPVSMYPENTKSVYVFSRVWLSLVEADYESLKTEYIPMLERIRSEPSNVVVSHLYSWMMNMELGRYKQAIASAEKLYAYSRRHKIVKGIAGSIRWFSQNIHRYDEFRLWDALKRKIIDAYYQHPPETNIERGIPLLRYVEIKRRGIKPKEMPQIKLIDSERIEASAEKLYSITGLPKEKLQLFVNNVVKSYRDRLKALKD